MCVTAGGDRRARDSSRTWVRVDEDLEAPVEEVAVDDIGAHAATGGVRRLEHEEVRVAAASQLRGAGQAAQPGADDDGLLPGQLPARGQRPRRATGASADQLLPLGGDRLEERRRRRRRGIFRRFDGDEGPRAQRAPRGKAVHRRRAQQHATDLGGTVH